MPLMGYDRFLIVLKETDASRRLGGRQRRPLAGAVACGMVPRGGP